MASPNMNLLIPSVAVTSGTAYATQVNNSLNIIDAHDHSAGSGVRITPSGLSINTTLPINNNILQSVQAVNFTAQSANAANLSLFFKGVDLYTTDGSGNVIRITQSGSVSGASGTITGLPSGTASAAYSSSTFVFQSATSTAANIDGGNYYFRNLTPNSTFAVELSAPNSLSSNYQIFLPALPVSGTSIMSLSSAGNMSSIAPTGTGLAVLQTSPTLVTPTLTSPTVTSPTMSSATFTGSTTFPGSTVITSTGSVGVGVNPSSYGFFTVSGKNSYVGKNVVGAFLNAASVGAVINIQDINSNAGVGIGAITNDLVFYNNSGGSLSETMRLNASGQLGIGSSAPTSLLNVGASNQFAVDTVGNITTSGQLVFGSISSSSANLVASTMTSTGANAIAATMTSTGANAIAATMTSTGANAIAGTISTNTLNASKLVNASITSTQLGTNSVTQAKLALRTVSATAPAGGVAIALSSGAFAFSAPGTLNITNQSVSLVTTGRPVAFVFQPDGSGTDSYVSSSGAVAQLILSKDGTPIRLFTFGTGTIHPASAFSCIDYSVTAGTHTYSLALASGGSTILTAFESVMVCYEI